MKEIEIQALLADYIRHCYPDVIFHSDFGSGIKLSMGQAIRQKRLNGGIDFKRADHQSYYTIDELCGEGEE